MSPPVTADSGLEAIAGEAMAALQGGRFDSAIAFADQALAIASGNYEATQVKALALLHSGRAPEALPLAERLAAQFADDAFSHNTHAAVLEVLGRMDEAIAAYGRATSLAPTYADAWFNLGRACAQGGRHLEAARALDTAIRAGVQHPHARLLWNVSSAFANLQSQQLDAALAFAREGLRLAPEFPDALLAAAQAETSAGDDALALAAYRKLESVTPDRARWRLTRAVAWPPIIGSRMQLAERLAETEHTLDDLIAAPPKLADPFREIGTTAFYMAYGGFDDTAIQRRIAKVYALACPALLWTAPHVATPRSAAKRIRLGILSNHLRNHTIGKLNIGIAQKLDRARFEVVVLRPPCVPDFLSTSFDQVAERVVTLPMDLEAARHQVAQAELDALFYPDIGMDPFTYYLAFARLARVQFTTWGHPVTTGLDNMDYFLSTRHAEPPEGQRFYHEKLVEMENLPSYYYKPREASPFDIRASLGLARDARLYACPQTLYKFHPDFDAVLMEILRRDPAGRIVIVAAGPSASWSERLKRRLGAIDAESAKRIVFHAPLPLPDFFALLRDADALLDTIHFGGGSSSYEALSLGSPVCTLPSTMMRGRITAAWYRAMGVSRWVARSPEHFVELALDLAHGRERRAEWREEIRAGVAKLLEDEAVVRELETFVEDALAR